MLTVYIGIFVNIDKYFLNICQIFKYMINILVHLYNLTIQPLVKFINERSYNDLYNNRLTLQSKLYKKN